MKAKPLLRILAVLFWLLIWQAIGSWVNNDLLIAIPTPITTLTAFSHLLCEKDFLASMSGSLLRICAGFIMATICGIIGAILSDRFPIFSILARPLINLVQAMPVASFTILVFLWIARGRIPSVIVFITVIPIIWSNFETGLKCRNKQLTEMATVFGMKKCRVVVEIVFPQLRPYLQSALSSGVGFAWKSGVAAEVICRTNHSLGNYLWIAKSAIDYDSVFATTLTIILLSAIIKRLVHHITDQKRVFYK